MQQDRRAGAAIPSRRQEKDDGGIDKAIDDLNLDGLL